MINILFVGCVKSSAILLNVLLEHGMYISGVVTQKESSYNADFCSLDEICEKHSIDYCYTKNINGKDTVEFIMNKKPDVIYCFGWSRLLKEEVLNIPRLGTIGFHPADLPNNRGRHPIIWALVLGLDKTASTFFLMDMDADTGAIVSKEEIAITYFDDAASIYDKVMECAKKQVIDITNKIENGTLVLIPQEKGRGNTWRKRNMYDGQIDWRMSGKAIYNTVRALAKPYPGAHFIAHGREIKIWKVEEIDSNGFNNIEPGKVLKVNSETDYYIKAYDKVIHVIESDNIQLTEGEYLQ